MHSLLRVHSELLLITALCICLASHDIALASPAFDRHNPPETENFDPAEADPASNITCVGSSYDLDLPVIQDSRLGLFNPNEVSVHKLCAKPQFGGGAPGQHVGGFCSVAPSAQNGRTGDIAFDRTIEARTSLALYNPRVLLGCFYRCFCNQGVTDRSVQPRSNSELVRTVQLRSLRTYEIDIDIENDFNAPYNMKYGTQGNNEVDALVIFTLGQVGQALGHAGVTSKAVSLNQGNKIDCRGDFPTFVLPDPYQLADFENLQQLCAVQLSGGLPGANAGGYCHRTPNPDGTTKRTVWFSDEQTPRLDWTWRGNFFVAASIRFHCWQRCACAGPNPTFDNITTSLWQYVQGHELALRGDGSVDSRIAGKDEGVVQVLPAQSGPGSPSGTCGGSGTQFCAQGWNFAALGAVPRAPPGVTDVVTDAATVSAGNLTVCGNKCTGPQDCVPSGSGAGHDCACAYPSPQDAVRLGFDPVMPVAVCLVLGKGNLMGKRDLERQGQGRGGVRGTGGRMEGYVVDERGEPYRCRCNVTFAAKECCGVGDGMVWL